MFRVALDRGWQGGDAYLELYGDIIAEENGVELGGVVFELVTPLDMTEESDTRIALGAGHLEFPAGHGRLKFMFAARDAEARELAEAILSAIGKVA